jgi:hypothetical protein
VAISHQLPTLHHWRLSLLKIRSQYVLVSSNLVGLATRYYFLSVCCCLKFAVLFLWGSLSDERTGMKFLVQSLNGPSRAKLVTVLYCLIWDPPPPNLEGQVPVFISPRNKVAELYSRALGSLYVSFCDSQGYVGDIRTLPQPGGPGPHMCISLRNRMVQSIVLIITSHGTQKTHLPTVLSLLLAWLLRRLPSNGRC